ncbi:uncharacterized protein EV420DRAFT_1642758 [Desarmillaria tabescens]|uniref:Uncharacterized protein n=1 Tax=Armillaria tabescens TaxID=1929756 RepID=A0AA39KC28_ARMTA|nr:uncharacterized protein EV420DRAFT_1642758 [Desarmillaria tabescens]KAK0458406.1 hypothetical protein EV420DRAFT_1642758 [Desarmillaria tabescens]
MSSAALPSRRQCTQVIDNIQRCQCPCFIPPASILLDQNICGLCGHGIHTHVDYVSMVVNHHPPTQCAAYVQKTPLTQCCTCEAWLCDHVAINNPYRPAEPWDVLNFFMDNIGLSSGVNATSFYNNAVNGPFTPNPMLLPSAGSHTDALFHDMNLMPINAAPVLSPSPNHAFSPSRDAGSVPLTPTSISSPSASSSSDDYFVQFPHHFMNNSYALQSDGSATDENLYDQI